MWRWLDRERLLREERVLGRLKAKEAGQWFQRCTEARLETAAARAERDNGRADLDAAIRLREVTKTEHDAEMKALMDERDRWERLAGHGLIPSPTSRAHPDDRAGMYRLEAENDRLRIQLAAAVAEVYELRTKYEGNPS